MYRVKKTNTLFQKYLSNILHSYCYDFRLKYICILYVDYNIYKNNATIVVTSLDHQSSFNILQLLHSASGFINRKLSKKMNLKPAPILKFIYKK